MTVLVLAEHDNKELKPATLNAVGAATKIGGDVHVMVIGAGCDAVAQAAANAGVSKVLKADDASLAHGLAENAAPSFKVAAITAISSARNDAWKTYCPAYAMSTSSRFDIIAVHDADTFDRPFMQERHIR